MDRNRRAIFVMLGITVTSAALAVATAWRIAP
jgi:hypothetical protein